LELDHKIGYNLLPRLLYVQNWRFWGRQFNGVIQICPRPTPVATVTKTFEFRYKNWRLYCTAGTTIALGSATHSSVTSKAMPLFNKVITIAIQLRYDYDVLRAPASIRREQKMNVNFSS